MANKQFVNCFKWAILWMIVVAVLMTLPGQSLPKYSWTKVLMIDKWVHIFIYAVLVVTLYWGYFKYFSLKTLTLKNIGPSFLIAFSFSIFLEIIQKTLASGRSFDWHDIAANLVGCIFGVLFIARLKKKLYF